MFHVTPFSCDSFLGGRVRLWQPARGYRAGVDPVFLAAACPASPGETVLELGCGVGAASLCLGARVAGLRLTGVERHGPTAALARRNAEEHHRPDAPMMEVIEADLSDLPADLRARSFDHVIANPPYFDRNRGSRASGPAREAAMGEETPLAVWLDCAARRLRPRGWLTLIHHPTRLPDILKALPDRLGSVEILPLAPRIGREASLILIRARKGGGAAPRLHFPVILHEGARHLADGEDYSRQIRAVLRDGAPMPGFAP
ncbi:MAG: methyltransferase [Celeribacter sp.]